MSGGVFAIRGRGSDIAIEVRGPDAAACLAAAVRGFAALLVDPAPAPSTTEELSIAADGYPELLLELMDACILQVDAHGLLPVDLTGVRAGPSRAAGTLHLVTLAEVDIIGAAPKAATWHDLALAPVDDTGEHTWAGQVMLDL